MLLISFSDLQPSSFPSHAFPHSENQNNIQNHNRTIFKAISKPEAGRNPKPYQNRRFIIKKLAQPANLRTLLRCFLLTWCCFKHQARLWRYTCLPSMLRPLSLTGFVTRRLACFVKDGSVRKRPDSQAAFEATGMRANAAKTSCRASRRL